MASRGYGRGANLGRDGDLLGIGQEISIDARVAALASRQHGNVTRAQLLCLGLNDYAIHHRARTGRLHRIHPGVYAVGRPPKTALELASAALLACGPAAALSHSSAMALWGLWTQWPRPLEVTIVTGDRRPKGIRVHHPGGLSRRDLRKRHGLWVTSPARTLLDIAPRLADKALTRVVNDARLSHHLKLEALRETLDRFPNHRGAARLAALARGHQNPTRSVFEDEFVRWCKRHGLPTPKLNTNVAGYEVDALFEQARLIVELDGYEFHSDRPTFERDRAKDADTLTAGFSTIRLTPARLTDAEAARLLELLRRGRAA